MHEDKMFAERGTFVFCTYYPDPQLDIDILRALNLILRNTCLIS